MEAFLGLSGPSRPSLPSGPSRWQQTEDSFDKDFYPVREARDELARRGLDVHLETLRRWIRDDKVRVSGPARKTVIHKGELTRILMGRKR